MKGINHVTWPIYDKWTFPSLSFGWVHCHCRDITSDFEFSFQFSMKIAFANRITPDGTPRSKWRYIWGYTVCLCLMKRTPLRLTWVKDKNTTHCNCAKNSDIPRQFLFTDRDCLDSIDAIYEPRLEKTGLRVFRPGMIQTRLYSHRNRLDAWNIGY